MNYAELVAAIKAYAENYDNSSPGGFVENIPVFVKQAEQRIYNTVQIPSLRKNVTGVLTVNNKYLSAPIDYLATYSLAVIENAGTASETYSYLLNKDVNFIRESFQYPSETGKPAYYALFGPQYNYPNELSFILGPTPDDNYNVEMHYFYYPESIVTAGTSWLGDNFDTVLLYGSLLEADAYMKSDADIITYHKDRYTEALSLLKRLGDGLERGDAYRDGQTKLNTNLKGNVVA
jgi:hypothetical protein